MADAASGKGVRGRGFSCLLETIPASLSPWKEARLNGTELSVTLTTGMSSPGSGLTLETLQCWFTVAVLHFLRSNYNKYSF